MVKAPAFLYITHKKIRTHFCALTVLLLKSGTVILVLKVVPYVLYVIVILEHIKKLAHALEVILICKLCFSAGDIFNLGGDKAVALCFEVVAYST